MKDNQSRNLRTSDKPHWLPKLLRMAKVQGSWLIKTIFTLWANYFQHVLRILNKYKTY